MQYCLKMYLKTHHANRNVLFVTINLFDMKTE